MHKGRVGADNRERRGSEVEKGTRGWSRGGNRERRGSEAEECIKGGSGVRIGREEGQR